VSRQLVCASIEAIGVHCWPDAPERQSFLRAKHRHTFCITAWKEVPHGDRAVECFDLADAVRESLEAHFGGDFGTLSCEQIASWLCNQHRLARCAVLEDGKQGAEVWT
jgi:hypothetical protein